MLVTTLFDRSREYLSQVTHKSDADSSLPESPEEVTVMVEMALQPEPSPQEDRSTDPANAKVDFPPSPPAVTYENPSPDLVPGVDNLKEHVENLLIDITPDTSTSSPDSSPSVAESPKNSANHSLEPAFINQLLCDESNVIFDGYSEVGSVQETSKMELVPDHDCLTHPTHISIVQQLDASKNTIANLQEAVNRLESKILQGGDKIEKYDLLEQAVAQQEKELELSRQEHEIDLRTIESLKSEMETKLSALKKQYDSANKEKETMVMRYAKNERELLDQKKAKENLEKRLKEAVKENEANVAKLKAIVAEKGKISVALDAKNTEVSSAYKEIDKLKEEINSRDIKIKWTQSKLKSEMEDHMDCPGRIEKLERTVKLLEEELDSLKAENLSLQRQLDGSEVNRNIESQLKEQQAKLIMEKHERAELETKFREFQSSHYCLKEENESLSSQVLTLEQERLAAVKVSNNLREERDELARKVSEFGEKLGELEQLRVQLAEEKERLASVMEELEILRKANDDLQSDMLTCRNREKEMLAFTQELTVKNVKLLSEFSAVEEKATELEKEEELLEQTSVSLKEEVRRLKEALKEEQTKRYEESRLLARQVAEKTTKSLNLESLLTDTQSELNLLRQKHTTALKEMQKELAQYRKRVDQMECNSSASGSDSVTQDSRTSSLSSLNDNSGSPYQVLDVPAHTLIDRIVKLQNDCAKQTERIEFLEEHTTHLVKELQKKSKLLQNYIMREQTGALTSKKMDRNKAEQAKHGGIMASLYSSKPTESMTLELSMEINRKLQAVLEDTLLKNITLKENLDTLGDEIARLSQKKT